MIDTFTEYMLVPTLLMAVMILLALAKIIEQRKANNETTGSVVE